ncbi:MAG: hypothetical protein ABL874_02820 [Sphingopyxis sp.]
MKSSLALIALIVLLGGCGAATTSANAPRSAGDRPAPNTYNNGAPARAIGGGGNGVIGRDAAALANMFGAPRLDRHDGAAHVLQFTNDRCVLDAYLYAPRSGAQPVVTHVDTRNLDGGDVDAAACIAALQRR